MLKCDLDQYNIIKTFWIFDGIGKIYITNVSAPLPPQIFTIVDLLPNDNDSEKKKSIVETYKPF